ncbi:MAG: A24 family peptidase [Candidatus Angelobacter sp.]
MVAVEMMFLAASFAWSAAGAAFDIWTKRIPNALSYSGILFGILLRTIFLGWHGLGTAFAGGLIGGGVFFLLYLVRAMGGGDVKLMTAVGCFTGPMLIVQIITACALAGGVMAIATMIYRKRTITTIRNVGELLHFRLVNGPQVHPTLNIDNPEAVRLPYGIAIAAGALYPLINGLLVR